MQLETAKKLFTVEEYYRMAEAGIIGPDERVELIDGEIFEMSPIGSRHMACVNRATRLFISSFGNRVVVSVQQPLRLSNYTEPEPDVVLLKPRADDYAGKRPLAEDAFLVVEVSETSLSYDLKKKLPRYAKAGVPEVWIENLVDDVLLVYREPAGVVYRVSLTLRVSEPVSAQALPDISFSVGQLLIS